MGGEAEEWAFISTLTWYVADPQTDHSISKATIFLCLHVNNKIVIKLNLKIYRYTFSLVPYCQNLLCTYICILNIHREHSDLIFNPKYSAVRMGRTPETFLDRMYWHIYKNITPRRGKVNTTFIFIKKEKMINFGNYRLTNFNFAVRNSNRLHHL